jgi:hypothetical protein
MRNMDGNSGLPTGRGSLLRDYAIRNTCLIYGPDSRTTASYRHNATPDVLDIVFNKGFVLPVYLTVCSKLSSDHLPIPIDTNVPIILSKPTVPTQIHANGPGCIPGLPWWQSPGESCGKRRGGNRQVRRGADQRHPRGHSVICSQVSTPCRPATPSTR